MFALAGCSSIGPRHTADGLGFHAVIMHRLTRLAAQPADLAVAYTDLLRNLAPNALRVWADTSKSFLKDPRERPHGEDRATPQSRGSRHRRPYL